MEELTCKFKDEDTLKIREPYLSQENIKIVYSLEKSLDYLKKKSNPVDLVLINLNIAPVPKELQAWRDEYFRERELNHGQLLGM